MAVQNKVPLAEADTTSSKGEKSLNVSLFYVKAWSRGLLLF